MRTTLIVLINLLLVTGLYAQDINLRLNLSSEGEPVEGLRAEVWLKQKKISELKSDDKGVLKLRLESEPGLELSLMIPASEFKRYVIYLKELDADYEYNLDLEALSLSEQQRIDLAQEGKAKLRDDFGTVYLMYDKYLNRIEPVEKEKISGSFKLVPINVMLIEGNRIGKKIGERADDGFKERERAYNKEQAEIKRKEKLREEYNQKKEDKEEEKEEKKEEKEEEKQEAREEQEREAAQEAKDLKKWEKKLKKYEKKVDKYKDQLDDIAKDQRKLDRRNRKGKLSPNDFRDQQDKINKDRRRTRDRLQDAEKTLKKHRKDKP